MNGLALDEPYVSTEGDGRQETAPMPGKPSQWLVPDGELFVMGDYRRASADSRSFGQIGVSAVIGRAWVRVWPIDAVGILSTPGFSAVDRASH